MLSIAFTLLGTPVTWLELIAFWLAIANIVCNVRELHWAWPLTMVASLLYAWLFYVSKLYGETGVNLFFAATAIWGWWQWVFAKRGAQHESLQVIALGSRGRIYAIAAWLVLWMVLAQLLSKFTDTDVAWADAFVTSGSVVGTVLLGRKYVENWLVWLVVNAASVALFIHKNLLLTALLYILFFVMAAWGWRAWNVKLRQRAV
ncbi:MAG: nicotinamide riboside transporter PnuC [Betaproteobacteria bacterium]|nr:MAG: nicotinamide riboside transporter PnuC [Betaproteobacteria bacterium]